MKGLNPQADFRDDGGTPEWRRRQSRIIDAKAPGFRAWWKRTPLWRLVVITAIFAFGVPWGILIFGLGGAYLLSKITGG